MAMIVAYFDESGWEQQSPICFYAGLVGYAERWAQFSEAWDAFAGADPKTPDFHMTRAFQLTGKHSYWGHGTHDELVARRDTKLMGFAKIIREHILFRVSSGVGWAAYKDYIKGKVPPEHDSPLFFSLVSILGELARWHKAFKIPEPIDLIFDRQNRLEKYVPAWFNHIVETIDPYAAVAFSGPPAFRCSQRVIPLKGADFLAWQLRRDVAERVKRGGDKSGRRPELDYLTGTPWIDASLPSHGLKMIARTLSPGGASFARRRHRKRVRSERHRRPPQPRGRRR
jgi:hypothetical protein